MEKRKLENRLREAAANEHCATKDVVSLVAEALKNGFWSDDYVSALRWLVRELRYSDSAARRRLNAARVLLTVPETANKIASGQLTLSALARAQNAFYREEQLSQSKLPDEYKRSVVARIENLSCRATDRLLAEEFPQVFATPPETLRSKTGGFFSLTTSFTSEQMATIDRARELLSHALPHATWADVLTRACEDLVRRQDPLKRAARRNQREQKKKTSVEAVTEIKKAISGTKPFVTRGTVPTRSSQISEKLRDETIAKAGGVCEFLDLLNGERCTRRENLQVDHIVPRALGGGDEPTNLRCLCRFHNLAEAKRKLGQSWSSAWKKQRGKKKPRPSSEKQI